MIRRSKATIVLATIDQLSVQHGKKAYTVSWIKVNVVLISQEFPVKGTKACKSGVISYLPSSFGLHQVRTFSALQTFGQTPTSLH